MKLLWNVISNKALVLGEGALAVTKELRIDGVRTL